MKAQANSLLLHAAALAFAYANPAYAADVTFSASANYTDTQSYDNGTITGYRTDVALDSGANYTFNGNVFVQGAWNRLILNSGASLVVTGTVSLDVSGISLNGGTLTTGAFKVHDSPNWDGTMWDGKQTIERGDSVINGSTIIANQSNANFISRAISPDYDWAVANWLWLNGDGATIDSNGYDIGNTMNTYGSGGLTKIGSGTLSISAFNYHTGNTTLSGGVLEVTSAGKLHSGGYTTVPIVTLGSGTILKLNGWDYDSAGSLGALDFSRERFVVNGGTIEYVGATNSTSGGAAGRNFTVGTGGATLKASSGSGQLWFIAANTLYGYGNLVNDTGLTLDGAGAGEIEKVIEGTGTLTKSGAGKWTLSGTNTSNGNTTVSAGTLKVTGSLAASNVTVNGGILASGSVGTVGNTVSVNSGATFAAGDVGAVGTANVANDLNFSSGAIFDWDLNTGSNTYDTVDVAGALNITSGAVLNVVSSTAFSDVFWDTSHTWSNIFGGKTLDNFLVSNFLYSGSATAPSAEGYFTVNGSSLSWTAVPEISNILIGTLLGVGLLRRKRSAEK